MNGVENTACVHAFRSEKKYAISATDLIVLNSRLSSVLERDTHSLSDGSYTVRTLYFDDIENTALADREAGNPLREKIRIRFYNGDTSFIRLEKKVKRFEGSTKLGVKLTRAECERLLRGNTDFPDDAHPLIKEICARIRFERLAPVSVSQYCRRAFVYPPGDTRVTLDSSLYVSDRCDLFFAGELPWSVPYSDGEGLLEIKYTGFLPDFISKLVGISDTAEQGFSKYRQSRLYY